MPHCLCKTSPFVEESNVEAKCVYLLSLPIFGTAKKNRQSWNSLLRNVFVSGWLVVLLSFQYWKGLLLGMTWNWRVDRAEPKARRQQVTGDKLEGEYERHERGDERFERGDEGDEGPSPTSHKQINWRLNISAAEKPKIRYHPSDDNSPQTDFFKFQHFSSYLQ